jgi:hypothetical protein
VGSTKDLRPELPSRSVDSAALDAAKELMRDQLAATDFQALFPTAEIKAPAAGSSVTKGTRITVHVVGRSIMSIMSCTLFVDGSPVDRRNLPRSEQGQSSAVDFTFLYDVPADRPLGPMSIEARVYSIETSLQGPVLDTAINEYDGQFRGAVGSQDDRVGRLGSTSQTNPKLEIDPSQFLRTPEGVSTITVTVI